VAKTRGASVAMVCSKCEKKLSRGIHQEMWKDGSRHTIEGGGRKINQNMALSGKKRWTPYGGATGGSKCKICKQSLHQQGIYCQKCAYHHGMCSMCGVKVMDTTFYNMGGESKEAMAARRADEIAATTKEDSDDPTGIDGPKAPEQDEEEKEDAEDNEAREALEKQDWLDKEEERRRKADEVAANRIQGTTDLAAAAREHATAATGKQVTGWQYDANSGYYYDVASQMYFDPQTQRYFDCKANKWIESEKPSAEKLATGDVKPVSFAKGTRQPDRWGL